MRLDGYEKIEKSPIFLDPMTTVDLFPTLRGLPRAEKKRMIL
jgi:competence transcription factor ComK